MLYVIKFWTVIRGHEVYKTVWRPTIGEELYAKHDEREEAKDLMDLLLAFIMLSTGRSWWLIYLSNFPV